MDQRRAILLSHQIAMKHYSTDNTTMNNILHRGSPTTIIIDDINSLSDNRRTIMQEEEPLSMKKSQSAECAPRKSIEVISYFQRPKSNINKEDQHIYFSKAKKQKLNSHHSAISSSSISLVVELLKKLHESLKVNERNRRLSKCLLLLRQAQIDLELSRSIESRKSRNEKRKKLGDLGAALFSPLDAAFGYDDDESDGDEFAGERNLIKNDIDDEDGTKVDDNDSVVMEPITIVKECPGVVLESPYILPTSMMQKIADTALPSTLHGMAWKRLYSLNRDGDSFQTFLRNVQNQSNTLIVARTMKDSVFGAFADSSWEEPKNTTKKHFYGIGGRSFLFSVNKDNDPLVSSPDNSLNIYQWTGENDYNQICDVSGQRIAMGGGGLGFGLCLEENFARGSSEHCDTFHNQPLVKEGYFEILELEVFGFTYPWCL